MDTNILKDSLKDTIHHVKQSIDSLNKAIKFDIYSYDLIEIRSKLIERVEYLEQEYNTL